MGGNSFAIAQERLIGCVANQPTSRTSVRTHVMVGKTSREAMVTDSKPDVPGIDELLEERVNERTRVVTRAKRAWESTFDAIVDLLAIVDDRMRIVRTNIALAAYAEQDVRSLAGRHCYEVLFGKEIPYEGCPVPTRDIAEVSAAAELRDVVRNRVLKMSSFPMRAAEDEPAEQHMVIHFKDITEEKALQRQLVQSEKMAAVGTLAGGVAHEINNPIGAILAFAQMGLQDSTKGTSIHDFFEEIEDSALRCKRIVASLLDFSRTSQGRRDPVSLVDVAERALFLCKRRMEERKVRIQRDFLPSTTSVIGDSNQIQQVVLNLLNNAADACSEGGTVRVATEQRAEENVVLIVSDDGDGMPADVQAKIFEPFFTTKPEGEGTGLGLSISYGIMTDHEGTIDVESRIGDGTAFRLVFPWPQTVGDKNHE